MPSPTLPTLDSARHTLSQYDAGGAHGVTKAEMIEQLRAVITAHDALSTTGVTVDDETAAYVAGLDSELTRRGVDVSVAEQGEDATDGARYVVAAAFAPLDALRNYLDAAVMGHLTMGESLAVLEDLMPEDSQRVLAFAAAMQNQATTEGFSIGLKATALYLLKPERRIEFVMMGPRCLASAAEAIRTLPSPT